MDLSHSGNKQSLIRGTLIEIENKDIKFRLVGDYTNKRAHNVGVNMNIPAKVLVREHCNGYFTLKTLSDFGSLVENSGITMKPCFFEDGQYQLILELKNEGILEIYHGGHNITRKFDLFRDVYLGIIDFSSDIGYTNIDIYKEGKRFFRLL